MPKGYIDIEELRKMRNTRVRKSKCAYCHRDLDGISFTLNGKKVCASCFEKNKARYDKPKADRAIDKSLAIDIEYDGYGEEEKTKSRKHNTETES